MPEKNNANQNDRKMSFLEHLDELRGRILISLAVIAGFSLCAGFWVKDIASFMIRQVPNTVFISPYEVILVYTKIALFCGLILSMPVIFFQCWRFVSSALSPSQKLHILLFMPLSCAFFAIGFLFSYFVIIPVSMSFFLRFTTDKIIPMISLDKYVSFVGGLCIFCGIVFQMPLLAFGLTKMKIITPAVLKNQWRHIIVGIFILAAVITPSTDIVNQVLLAAPMLILYAISVVIAFAADRF